MEGKKIIAIDLDGTTLNSQSKLSSKTIATLTKIKQQGHRIVIVTGRPWRMSQKYYQELDLRTPIVNFNGGLVHFPDHENWNFEQEAQINKDYILELMKGKERLDLEFMSVENKITFLVDNFSFVEPSFFGDQEFTEANRLTKENLKFLPNSMLIATDPLNKENLNQQLSQEYQGILDINSWGGDNGIMEVVPQGISKASGLKQIARYFQVPMEDTIAFGDQNNDLELLKEAGLGIAMANANDQLKEVADQITENNNDQDGVANYLEKYFGLAC